MKSNKRNLYKYMNGIEKLAENKNLNSREK